MGKPYLVRNFLKNFGRNVFKTVGYDNEPPNIPVSGKHLRVDAADNVLTGCDDYFFDAFYKTAFIRCDVVLSHSESPDFDFTW